MVAIGFLILAATVGATTILVMQNQGGAPVQFHALGHTWMLQEYWILSIGGCVALLAVVGAALMRAAAARTRQLRHEVDELRAENDRLTGGPVKSETFPFFMNDEQDEICPTSAYTALPDLPRFRPTGSTER